MKIDDTESFKKWLVKVLTPIFDGDAEKLALYIVALAKKIENDQQSRDRCIEDLQVFLDPHTNSFVDKLFDCLVHKAYMRGEGEASGSSSSSSNVKSRLSRDYQEIDLSSTSSRSNRTSRPDSSRNARTRGSSRRRSRRRSRNRSNRNADGGERRSSSRSSSSSLSPVNRRSRSRTRSPPRYQRYEKSTSQPQPQRCKDYDEKGYCTMGELCPYQHTNAVIAPALMGDSPAPSLLGEGPRPQLDINFSGPPQPLMRTQPQINRPFANAKRRTNTINNPPPRNQMYNNNNNNNDVDMGGGYEPKIGLPQQQQQFTSPQQRLSNMNRPRNLVNIKTSLNDNEPDMTNSTYFPNQRTGGVKRSLDSSMNRINYNPTNVNNNNNGQIADFGMESSPPGAHLQLQPPNLHQEQYNQSNVRMNQSLLPNPVMMGPKPTMSGAYEPTGLSMAPTSSVQYVPTPQSQLTSQVQPQPQPPQQQQQPPQQHYQPNNNQQQHRADNTVLIVRKIPSDLNREDRLRQHFAKFGTLVDVQCQYERQHDAAMIKFGTNQQAMAAFKCPQPVFNNRFIRLYWLNNYIRMQQQQQSQQQQQQQPVQQSAQHQPSNMDVEPPLKRKATVEQVPQRTINEPNKENQLKQNESKSSPSIAEVPSQEGHVSVPSNPAELAALKISDNQPVKPKPASAYEAFITAKQIRDENKKKAMLLKLEVQNKARELIEKQIKDQKILLEKFEKAKTVEEKTQIFALVKKISEAIEKEKEILNSDSDESHQLPKKIPPHHLLKLNNRRLNPTSFLKNKAAVAAAAGHYSPTAISSPVAAAGYASSRISVDHRPRKLLFNSIRNVQDKKKILNLITVSGLKVETVDDLDEASFAITFYSRKDAEIAVTKSAMLLKTLNVNVSWFKSEAAKNQPENSVSNPNNAGKEETTSSSPSQNPTQLQSQPSNQDDESIREPATDNNTNNGSIESADNSMDNSTGNGAEPQSTSKLQFEMDDNSDVFDSLFSATSSK